MRAIRWLLLVPLLVLLGGAGPEDELPDWPARLCRRLNTDDTLRHIPASLVPQINLAFGTNLPARFIVQEGVYRCANRQVMVCLTGANLPCGKANTSQENRGATYWCREHPDARFVPAYAAGHDTIYAWACRGTQPMLERQTHSVDPRGFIAEFWRALPHAGG